MYFALITFVIYFLQLTRDVFSGDVGDMVVAACIGGVPHPPGYPLFSLIGHTLCSLPLPLPPVTKVAMLSAAASSVAVYFFYRFAYRVTSSHYLSLLSSSVLAFSHLFWFHAEIPEVFGLHNMFVVLLLYLAYDYYLMPSHQKLYRLAAITGLALTHHQTTLFLGPALLISVLPHIKQVLRIKRSIVYAVGIATIAFVLPYIYVFIASATNPVINWGTVSDIPSLLHLIQRKAYGGFAPSVDNGIPLGVKAAVVNDYFKTLITNFSYQIVALAGVGTIYLGLRRKYALLGAFTAAWVFTGPIFAGYAATYYTTSTAFGIIERFYGGSFTAFAFLIPFGFIGLDTALSRFLKKPPLRLILISYFLIIPLSMIWFNYPKTDISKTQIGNNLAFDILDGLPKNAVLFASGDTSLFNLWYAQYVLNYRPDVDLINPPGVGGNIFLDETLNSFREKNPTIPLDKLVGPALDDLITRRPVFSTYDIPQRPQSTVLVPYGLIYQITSKDKIPSQEKYIQQTTELIRNYRRTRLETLTPAEHNLVTPEIPLIYSNALTRIGDFLETHYKDPVAAESFYRLALWRNPENSAAYAGLAIAQFKGSKDCSSALDNINRAVTIYPVWKTFHIQRYIIAKRCDISDAKTTQYKNEFSARFAQNIDEILRKQYKLEL